MASEPDEHLLQPSTFISPEFPWMLGNAKPNGEVILESILRLNTQSGGEVVGKFVPLFTDEDLARRFAESLAKEHGTAFVAFRFPLRTWMADTLRVLESLGTTHAYFDPNIAHTMPINRPYVPIAKLIERYRNE